MPKVKELLPPIAEEMNIPLDLARDLSDFYFDDVHRQLVSLEHYHIMVPHLGTFHIRGEESLKRLILKYSNLTNQGPPQSIRRYARYMKTLNILTNLKKLLEQYHFEENERVRYKQLRLEERTKKDLEKQKENPGGNI